MTIRDEQLALTRGRILETFLELSQEPGGKRTSVADVARRSGVSQATIYRHSRDRDALVAAAANHRLASSTEPLSTWGLSQLEAHLRELWRKLAGNVRVAREGVHSDAGRELRVARFDVFRTELLRLLDELGVDTASTEAPHLVASVALVTSATAFLDFHDRQGLSPDEAVDVAMWTTTQLLERAGVDLSRLERLDPGSEPETEPS
ncbi:MAG: TetR/AcrR family transcriptional regulator [Acidimicrobiia bacterium]|nr:TetR/AcrR family transcriptional regulator [Acidimicrobiia bacterium]